MTRSVRSDTIKQSLSDLAQHSGHMHITARETALGIISWIATDSSSFGIVTNPPAIPPLSSPQSPPHASRTPFPERTNYLPVWTPS
jgi:hypothetical protein